jgi:hypothetical protein
LAAEPVEYRVEAGPRVAIGVLLDTFIVPRRWRRAW